MSWKGKQVKMDFEQTKQERFDFFMKCKGLACNTTDEISKCSVFIDIHAYRSTDFTTEINLIISLKDEFYSRDKSIIKVCPDSTLSLCTKADCLVSKS